MGGGRKGQRGERERESSKSWSLHPKQTSVDPVTGGLKNVPCGRTLQWLRCTYAHSREYDNDNINKKSPPFIGTLSKLF